MIGWEGSRKGPCTLGEAKTMTAIITGCQPEDVEAFIAITVLKCEDCGIPHNLVTNTNLPTELATRVLTIASLKFLEEK